MRIPLAFSLAILLFISVSPSAQSTAYTFITLDLPEPDPFDGFALPEDINDDGLIVANVVSSTGTEVLLGSASNATSFRCAQVEYSHAYGASVNDFGEITGNCVTDSNSDQVSGFVRDRRGRVTLLNVPGADNTLPAGINKDGHVVGTYYNPVDGSRSGLFRIHGFKWDRDSFQTVDFPAPNSYTTLRSINANGHILGEYITFDPVTNETRAHNWFVYDGQFRVIDRSLEWQGGPGLRLADISDDGRILGVRHNGGAGWDGLVRFEGGSAIPISLPGNIYDIDVRGMNNKGQFVGYYVTDSTANGYVATPANVPFTVPESLRRRLPGTTSSTAQPSATTTGIESRPAGFSALTYQQSQAMSIACPAPVLTSFDAQPMSVTLLPAVEGGVQPIATSCSPRSGSHFPVGQTPISCSAVDARSRRAECRSSVVVLAPR